MFNFYIALFKTDGSEYFYIVINENYISFLQ